MMNPSGSITFDSIKCRSNLAKSNGGCVYYTETGSNAATLNINIATSGAGSSLWNSNTANSNGGIFYINCP